MEHVDHLLVVLLFTLMVSSVLAQIEIHLQIAEGEPVGTPVGSLSDNTELMSRIDPSKRSEVEFILLTEGNEYSSYFSVASPSGDMKTEKLLDREMWCAEQEQCELQLDLIASGSVFILIKVYINLLDRNDEKPTFLDTTIKRTILEDSDVNTKFRLPSAVDKDSPAFGIQSYNIVSGVLGVFELQVTNSSGELELHLIQKQGLDREDRDSYTYVISATDKGPDQKTGMLRVEITVMDVNDNAPVFDNPHYTTMIPEDFAAESTILTVTATDLDTESSSHIIYGFTSQTASKYGAIFQIDSSSGDIILLEQLDFEGPDKSYSLMVTAREDTAGSIPTEAKVTVQVSDINDTPPKITVNPLTSSRRLEVTENTLPDKPLAIISVQDPDTGDGGKFTCSLYHPKFLLQDEQSGEEFTLSLVEAQDREDMEVINLEFNCVDKGSNPLSSTEFIQVTILDVNDNAPEFVNENTDYGYLVEVEENNQVGDLLVQLTASDPDSGANGEVTYHMLYDVGHLMSLDSKSGQLTAVTSFDRETMQQGFKLLVLAVDQGTPQQRVTANITVVILDRNDESPQFSLPRYNFNIDENQMAGQEIGQVIASDQDNAPYNTFTFSFRDGSLNTEEFAIDTTYGKIFSKRQFDTEEKSSYDLVVVATDSQNSTLTTGVSVTVTINDVNDNPPTFIYPLFNSDTVHVPSRSPRGWVVTTVQATDPDTGVNAELLYGIQRGNTDNAFIMDSRSGALMVNSDLRDLSDHVFALDLLVRDEGSPTMESSVRLHVIVNSSLVPGDAQDGEITDKDSDGLVSTKNLTILIVVAIISGVLIVILLGAIVLLRHQEVQRRRRKYMSKLLTEGSPTSTESGRSRTPSTSRRDSCNNSSLGDTKDISFSSSVQMCDELPYMEKSQVRILPIFIPASTLHTSTCPYSIDYSTTHHISTCPSSIDYSFEI